MRLANEDTLGWNPEDGWILALCTGRGLSWTAVAGEPDEHVVKLAAQLVGRPELKGITRTISVTRCYRPAGWIRIEDGVVVGVVAE